MSRLCLRVNLANAMLVSDQMADREIEEKKMTYEELFATQGMSESEAAEKAALWRAQDQLDSAAENLRRAKYSEKYEAK